MLPIAANLGLHGVTPLAGKSLETLASPAPADATSSRAGHGIGLVGMIWAQDSARVIGADGGMLWRVPADFKHFKETTLGWPVLMGRASFTALGSALPGRRNIVLTKQQSFTAPEIEVAHSVDQALEMCAGTEQVWITGGGQLYREVIERDLADLLVVTELKLTAKTSPGALVTYAPEIDPQYWTPDLSRSDKDWRPVSGDCAWRVKYFQHH